MEESKAMADSQLANVVSKQLEISSHVDNNSDFQDLALDSESTSAPAPSSAFADPTAAEPLEYPLTLAQTIDVLVREVLNNNIQMETTSLLWELETMEGLRKSAKIIAVAQKSKDDKKIAALQANQWVDFKTMLWAIFKIPTANLQSVYRKDTHPPQTFAISIKSILELIVNPAFYFSTKYTQLAEALLIQFEQLKWGERPAKPAKVKDSETSDTEPKKKRAKTADSATRTVTSQSVYKQPPLNHPVYGPGGIMFGILSARGPPRTYCMSPTFVKTTADRFGHNGSQVGAWWALQIAALRDGCHGHRVAGIAGTTADGCRSIVVASSDYDDADTGNKILYSSVHCDTLDAVRDNQGAKTLLRSIVTQLPVRVIRGAGGKWAGAPEKGLRYDGLYRVVRSKEIQKSEHGKDVAFCVFEMVREAGQLAINRSVPSRRQIASLAIAQQGYPY